MLKQSTSNSFVMRFDWGPDVFYADRAVDRSRDTDVSQCVVTDQYGTPWRPSDSSPATTTTPSSLSTTHSAIRNSCLIHRYMNKQHVINSDNYDNECNNHFTTRTITTIAKATSRHFPDLVFLDRHGFMVNIDLYYGPEITPVLSYGNSQSQD